MEEFLMKNGYLVLSLVISTLILSSCGNNTKSSNKSINNSQQTDFTTIIYHLIHRKFCQKASILDFEPPHVAVFVAVFFVCVSLNKKKSYKSVKF